jgi:hypothetical protein
MLVTSDDQYGIFATTNDLMVINISHMENGLNTKSSTKIEDCFSLGKGRFNKLIFGQNE